MHASVFRLREMGVRLPRPKRPVDGNLVLDVAQVGEKPTVRAQLIAEGASSSHQALPELLHARVMRITLNGIVITGMEYIARGTHSKSNVARHRQTWWCLVHTLSAAQSVGLGDTYEDEVFEGNGP